MFCVFSIFCHRGEAQNNCCVIVLCGIPGRTSLPGQEDVPSSAASLRLQVRVQENTRCFGRLGLSSESVPCSRERAVPGWCKLLRKFLPGFRTLSLQGVNVVCTHTSTDAPINDGPILYSNAYTKEYSARRFVVSLGSRRSRTTVSSTPTC